MKQIGKARRVLEFLLDVYLLDDNVGLFPLAVGHDEFCKEALEGKKVYMPGSTDYIQLSGDFARLCSWPNPPLEVPVERVNLSALFRMWSTQETGSS